MFANTSCPKMEHFSEIEDKRLRRRSYWLSCLPLRQRKSPSGIELRGCCLKFLHQLRRDYLRSLCFPSFQAPEKGYMVENWKMLEKQSQVMVTNGHGNSS